jgi:hypothetical protein
MDGAGYGLKGPKMLLRRRNFLAVTLGLPLLCRSHALAEASSKPVEIGFAYEGIAPAGAVRAKALQEGLPPGASRKAATSLS